MRAEIQSVGVGIDIESVKRFRGAGVKKVFRSIFTKRELKYCSVKKDPAEHLAARYAGKEAVIKALSDLDDHYSFNPKDYLKIEILNNAKSVPKVSITGLHIRSVFVKISLTHTKDIAGAVALAIKQ